MKRWLLAVAFLLGASGVASADYVLIIADLNEKKETPPPGGNNMGVPGGGMRGGMPGGQMGRPGMGMMGGGMRGGMMMGGGMRGMMSGVQMGRPGMGMRGGGMMMGGSPGGPKHTGDTDIDAVPYLVVAVLEVEGVTPNYAKHFANNKKVVFRHQWGGTFKLKQKDGALEAVLLKVDGKPLATVSHQFKKRFDEAFKDTPITSDIVGERGLAHWTLEHGLIDQFATVMDKLAETDKTHPVVAAYLKVKAELNRPPSKADVAGEWKRKVFSDYRLTQTDKHHYALLHTANSDALSEVKPQLDLLERTFRGYYYWWALHGIALPVPKDRLMAVMTDEDDDFNRLHKHLTAGPVVTDAFFARRENLVVFSARRGDQPYGALKKAATPYWEKGFTRAELLTGRPNAGVPTGGAAYADNARLMALLLKAREREWEATGISHEASRQLLFASGLLPSSVAVPEWLQFGMGALFETPLQSPWPSLGAPSPYWLPRYKELSSKGKLGKTPYETLVHLVTDGYYREWALGESAAQAQGKTQDPAMRKNQDVALRKARAASWSLAYFLAQKERAGLQRYFQELGKMPRDMELDDKLLLDCFARAFECVDSDRKVSIPKLTALANRWDSYIKMLSLEAEGIHKQIRESFERMNAKPATPSTPPTNPGGNTMRPPTMRPPTTRPPRRIR
jgi:hypothetical protein